MSRPVYETSNIRQKEKVLADRLGVMWDIVAKQNPKFYAIDLSFVNDNGEVEGLGEIKTRTHKFGTFPTYMLSVHKAAEAKALASATGKRVLLVVQWSCETIAFLDLDTTPTKVEWGGRVDRGDGQDMAPVNPYPIEDFTIAT